MLSASRVGSFDARKTHQQLRPGFEKNEIKRTDSEVTITPANFEADRDGLWDDTLDEFEWSCPTPKASELNGAKPKAPPLSFHECIEQTLTRLREGVFAPPQEEVLLIKARKLPVATQLASWMNDTLKADGAELAVVARQGGLEHKKHDKTGMLHSGIAMYHPRENRWKIYNLVDNATTGASQCGVQWTEPVDFFSQQGGYQKNALLLIPDKTTQQKMHKALLNGDYRKLVFTPDYNLISAPDSATSLNCNKWILMNILAAQKDTYDPKKLLAEIRSTYKPGQIDVHPFVRLFAAHQPKIKASEVPWLAPIHTVTVESLLNSGLFEKAKFCPPAEGEPAPDPDSYRARYSA